MSSKTFLEDPEYVPETPQSSQRNVLNSCKTDGLNKSKSFMETPSKTASGFDSRDRGINQFGSNKSHSLNRFYEPSHEDRCELWNRDDQKYVNTLLRGLMNQDFTTNASLEMTMISLTLPRCFMI